MYVYIYKYSTRLHYKLYILWNKHDDAVKSHSTVIIAEMAMKLKSQKSKMYKRQ